MLEADDLLGGGPLGREALLQPAQGRSDGRVLVAQALEELDAGRRGEGRPREAAHGCRRAVGVVRAEAEEAVGELVGRLPRSPAPHDLLGEAPEIVHEEDPEGDRGRPELADRERLHFLVRPHHAPQALRVETAVRVGDIRPGEAQDPRVALEMASGQLGELAVVVRGQVVADLAELLVDDRVVVDEPLSGRCDPSLVLDRAGQDAVGLQQDAAVLGDAGPDVASPTGRGGDRLGGGQRPGVLFQPLHTEELGEDRLFELGLQANPPAIATRQALAWLVRSHQRSVRPAR